MIPANELRIGNWVLLYGRKQYEIRASDFTANPVIFDPIPLTPELLEKAGFEQRVVYQRAGLKIGYDGDDFLHARFTVIFEDIKVKVQYLHQLQNLYFALTGTELTIQL